MTQTPERYKPPYEIFLEENPEFEWFTNYQIEPRIKELPCPECGAGTGDAKCYNKRTNTLVESFYVHKSRILAFCDSVGITREQLEVMPYRRWPEADSYEWWGCFPYQSGGKYAKKPKEKFRTYEWAKECQDARQQYNAQVSYKNQKPPYTVEPMAYCPVQKATVRYDLVKKQ